MHGNKEGIALKIILRTDDHRMPWLAQDTCDYSPGNTAMSDAVGLTPKFIKPAACPRLFPKLG